MGVGNTTTTYTEPPPAEDSIFVGSDQRGYFIIARGKVRATMCYPLRDGLLDRLQTASDVPAVFVDLSLCEYMDSTFIGLLVAIDKRLQKGSGGRLHVMHPSPACLDLFRQIGLQDFLLIETGSVPPPARMETLEVAPGRPAADFVLGAHEALMETSKEARMKFSLLHDVLERTVKGEKTPGGTR